MTPPAWRRYIRFWGEDVRADVDDELAFHIEMRTRDNVAAGMTPDEARAEALGRFGDVGGIAGECRTIDDRVQRRRRRVELVDTVLQDVRYAARSLARSTGFTAAAVLTLALGIGATTAIFSVVHGVLLRPLPYPESERIVRAWQVNAEGNRGNVSDANFADLRAGSRSFSALAEMALSTAVSVTGGDEPVRVPQARVSREFIAVMGVQPARGRAFLPEEQQLGGPPAVLVSHDFWTRHLGGGSDAIGRTLTFGDRAHTVVGVMPRGFDYPAGAQLWVPREIDPLNTSRTAHNFQMVGRLADGVSIAQARADLGAVARRVKQELGDATWMVDADVASLRDELVGGVRPALLVLLGASAVLLVIACANVANLLLAKAATRQRELAVRRALGAGVGRLVQQFLVEALVLSLAAGALGVVLAAWGVRLLVALEPGNVPRLGEIGVSGMGLAFALGVAAATAVVLGLVTATRGSDDDLRASLAEGQRSSSGGVSSQRTRSALVVVQMAMTLVLLVGAGLLARSFLRLLAVDPGYRTDGALVLDVALPWPEDDAAGRRQVALYDELRSRLRALPGVRAVGGINALPLVWGNYSDGTFLILTRADEMGDIRDIREAIPLFEQLRRDESRIGQASYRVAGPGYFEAMEIPLVRGRLFEDRDGYDAPHVAVISETLARTRWPNEDPIGKVIQYGNMDGDLRAFTIVGVVGDVREASLTAEPQPVFYASYRQRPSGASRFNFVVQRAGDPAALAAPAREIVRSLAPDVPPRIRTLDEIVARSIADRRFSLVLLGAFGSAALLLAIVGVYGVISYLVTQREREIGIRIALGARTADVRRLVVGQALRTAAIGVGAGVIVALAATRLLERQLYGVRPSDPVTFMAIVSLLLAIALAAAWLPARRAARTDPSSVLRQA
ncbi:MAG TPA: ABC transporter permease [Gemmatimonadaceae bacterium]